MPFMFVRASAPARKAKFVNATTLTRGIAFPVVAERTVTCTPLPAPDGWRFDCSDSRKDNGS